MKERWEAILELSKYNPDKDAHECYCCDNEYKLSERMFYHIDKWHNTEINKIRHSSIEQ